MALNRIKIKKTVDSFVEYVSNQKDLSFDTLYGSRRFNRIFENSKQSGKGNNPFLKQDVFTTMLEGSEVADDVLLNIFQQVGDCNEKPKW